MAKNGITMNDLHTYALTELPNLQKKTGGVHFTSQGYAHLAKKVSQTISIYLEK